MKEQDYLINHTVEYNEKDIVQYILLIHARYENLVKQLHIHYRLIDDR